MAQDLRLRSNETLRALMRQWGVTSKGLGDMCGLHRSAIDHLVAGRRHNVRYDAAELIAHCFRIQLYGLFERNPEDHR